VLDAHPLPKAARDGLFHFFQPGEQTMLCLYDPNKYEAPKPWLVRVLADTESPKWGGLTRDQWILTAVIWAGIFAVVSILYKAFY
jgi:hypothetical protein